MAAPPRWPRFSANRQRTIEGCETGWPIQPRDDDPASAVGGDVQMHSPVVGCVALGDDEAVEHDVVAYGDLGYSVIRVAELRDRAHYVIGVVIGGVEIADFAGKRGEVLVRPALILGSLTAAGMVLAAKSAHNAKRIKVAKLIRPTQKAKCLGGRVQHVVWVKGRYRGPGQAGKPDRWGYRPPRSP